MKKFGKWTAGLLAVILVVVILIGSATYYIFLNSVFPHKGDYPLAGLSSEVTVVKDTNGVPHIEAASRVDAIRTLGFIHASERLWQMETLRMAGQGRLSEMFGKQTVGSDIFLKTMDFETAARLSVNSLSKDALTLIEAYRDGVNAYLDRKVELYEPVLPPEFIILGHKPDRWETWHSLVILKVMALTLGHNVKKEIGRMTLAGKGFSPEEIDQIYLYNRRDNPTPLPDLRRIFKFNLENSSLWKQPVPHKKAKIVAEPIWQTGVTASNSWVVSGSRTKSGKPLMANDPHLALTTPSTFFLAHLKFQHEGADFNLIGGTLAGTPLFLVGRNDYVSWGLTTTGLDSQDLYVEQVHRTDTSKYRTVNGYEKFEEKQVTVKVKGERDETFKRRVTRHGPVLPDSYHKIKKRLPIRTVGALRWIALADDDTTIEGALDMSMSKSVDQLIATTTKLVSPMQSIVAADVQGNIGLIAAGRVPVRSDENLIKGRAPVPGWLPQYEWQGYLAHSELPKIINPENGALVTANSHWLPADYPHHITYDWAEPYRQFRAEALYNGGAQKHDAETIAAGMADNRSDALLQFRDIALNTITPDAASNPQIVQGLRDWNGEMRKSYSQPLVLNAWLKHTNRLIFMDDLGDDFDLIKDGDIGRVVAILENQGSRNWCNKQRSPKFETCQHILDEALVLAISELSETYGVAWENWNWGEAHKSIHEHRPFTHVDALADFFTVSPEIAGGTYTLLRSKNRFSNKKPYATVAGAAYRAFYDFSDLNNSGYMISTGQSGNVMSDHYDDLAQKWGAVEFIKIPSDDATYAPGNGDVLTFTPTN